MHTVILCLLLLSTTSVLCQQNLPDVRLAFNYQVFDVIKTVFIKPMIESKVQNLTMNHTISFKKDLIHVELQNMLLKECIIDWDTSGLVVTEDQQQPLLALQNITAFVTFDSKSNFLKLHKTAENNTAFIKGLDIQIGIGAGSYSNGTSYLYMSSVDVSVEKMKVKMTHSISQMLLHIAQMLGTDLEDILGKAIKEQVINMNQTFIDLISAGREFTLGDLFTVKATLADLPFVFNVQHQAYQALALNVQTRNNQTNEIAPVVSSNVIPSYVDGDLPIQIIMSESMLEQMLWAAFQTDQKFVFSQDNIPKDFPASFTTTGLQILFPRFASQYGADKGVYVKVQKGGDYPRVFVRDGRLSGLAALNVSFVVDTSNAEYPFQGLDKCMSAGNCETAIVMNTTVFFSAVVYGKNETHLAARLMNLQFVSTRVVSGTLNGNDFEILMNKLFVSLLSQVNNKLENGIQTPLIGLFGMNDVSLRVGSNYLLLGVSFNYFKKIEE